MRDRHRPLVRHGYDEIADAYLAARPTDGADLVVLDELLAACPPGAPSSTRAAEPACRS